MRDDPFPPHDIASPRRGAQVRSGAQVRRVPTQALVCALALTVGAGAGLCLFYADAPVPPAAVAPPSSPPPAILPLRRAAALLDPSFTAPDFTAGTRPVTFTRTIALRAGFQPRAPVRDPIVEAALEAAVGPPPETAVALQLPPPAAVVPVPPSRPAALLAALEAGIAPAGRRRMARLAPEASAAPASVPEQPGFFDRMFGRAATAPAPALAYATPEAGLGLAGAHTPDRVTAVYDIAAHTVTLPDGTRLEAHSGLGSAKDDPRSVATPMRGATPPALYDLTPREALFHGVAALRLTPVGGANPYGRAGLLAHTYMLGPRGDSNGCVVFADYRAFRQAYDAGRVRRLVVVARGS